MAVKFDPAEFARQAIASDLDPAIFNKIDEREIPRAKNWFEFVTSKQYLGANPFPRQTQFALHLFAEYCPNPGCTDLSLVNNLYNQQNEEITERITMFENGVCPKCGMTRIAAINKGLIIRPNELVVCAGRRSGKTVVSSFMFHYQLHRMLALPDPSKYYGLRENELLHMVFVAVDKKQAQQTLWNHFIGDLEASPWFNEYHSFLRAQEKKFGVKLFDYKKDKHLHYIYKNLIIYFSDANLRTTRGNTLFGAGIDELGWFDHEAESKKIRINAGEAYSTLDASLASLRTQSEHLLQRGIDVPTGIGVYISSPSSLQDKIMSLGADAETDKTKVFFHYATWEVNPRETYDVLFRLQGGEKDNFDRDFGAVPPLGDNLFIDDKRVVMQTLDKGRIQKKLIESVFDTSTDSFGDKTLFVKLIPVIKDKITPRILVFDMGYSSNSFTLGMMSFDDKGKIYVDFICEAEPQDAMRVNFEKMFEHAVIPLLNNYNIVGAFFDQWNSIQMRQRLRDEFKIEAIKVSPTYIDFATAIKPTLLSGLLSIPDPDIKELETVLKTSPAKLENIMRTNPALKLLVQIATVRQTGRKVLKPRSGNDDLFRSVCLGIIMANTPEFRKKLRFGRHVMTSSGGGPRVVSAGSRGSFGAAGGGFQSGSGHAAAVSMSRNRNR